MTKDKEMTEQQKIAMLVEKYKNNLPELFKTMKSLQVTGKSATISILDFMQALNKARGEIIRMTYNYNSQLLSLTRELIQGKPNQSPKAPEKAKAQIQGLSDDEKRKISQAIDQLAREFTAPSALVSKVGMYNRNRGSNQDPQQQHTTRPKGPGRRSDS